MRVGGIDVISHGLEQQTYKDFELILVDGLWKHRNYVFHTCPQRHFPAESMTGSYRVKHVEPFQNPFPINSFCRYSNTGLVHADCDIVVFITDYTWLPRGCLQHHVDYHEAHKDGAHGYMGVHKYLALPEVVLPRKYGRDEMPLLQADLASGALNPFMHSIFKEPFGGIEGLGPDLAFPEGRDPKVDIYGDILGDLFHAKNESVRLEHLLGVNGWDEDLDGSHCYQDWDLADRLTHQYGMRWFCQNFNVAYIVNPRTVFPVGVRTRPTETNKEIWQKKKNAGFPRVNKYDLTLARYMTRNNKFVR